MSDKELNELYCYFTHSSGRDFISIFISNTLFVSEGQFTRPHRVRNNTRQKHLTLNKKHNVHNIHIFYNKPISKKQCTDNKNLADSDELLIIFMANN